MATGHKTGGRTKGVPNKTTAEVKAALTEAFENLGGTASLVAWGRESQTEFYKLWVRMLPTEVKAEVSLGLEDLIDRIDGRKAGNSGREA